MSTHSEAWRRPALLRHNAELAHAEAHVFADESGHLHAPNEAVTTVQHRRHCSHKKRWARETAQSCCCSPEAQPELRAAVEGRGGWMGRAHPCSHMAAAPRDSTRSGFSQCQPAWPWGLWSESQLAACAQLKGLVNEGVQAKPATPRPHR